MARIGIFTEGGANEKNGSLRVALGELFRPAAKPGHQVQFVLCNDTAEAIKKFKAERTGKSQIFDRAYLLIDLEAPEAQRQPVLQAKTLAAHALDVFFMVQKMESWFLSQPAVVQTFYGPACGKLPAQPPADVPDPDAKLGHATDGTQKGRYHKIKHAVALLPKLKVNDLRRDFPDVERLVMALLM